MALVDRVSQRARPRSKPIDVASRPVNGPATSQALAQQYMSTVFGAASKSGSVGEVKPKPYRDLWHRQAFPLVKAVPEVSYVVNMMSDLLSYCGVTLQRRKPNTDEWEDSDDQRGLRVLRDLHGPIGGVGEILRQGAIQSMIIGEAYLFGDPVFNDAGRMRRWNWSFKSMPEVLVPRPGDVRLVPWGTNVEEYKAKPGTYVKRCLFNPDPEFSLRATSVIFNCLPLLTEMVSASQVIDAILRSQIHAGMFFMPQEVAFGPTNEWDSPGTPATGFDEAEEEMQEFMSGAMNDGTSVNRVQPLLMWGPGVIQRGDKSYATKELMGLVPLSREFDDFLQTVRQELIVRLARSLNIEPEVLTGMGQTNHFTGWLVDEVLIRRDVVPLGDGVLNWLTAEHLRPMLQLTQGMSPEDSDWFRYALDSSPIQSAPDKTNAATAAFNMLACSTGSWLDYMGMDPENDLPSGEEYIVRCMERLVLAQPSVAPSVMPWLAQMKGANVEFGATFDDWQVGTSTPGGANLVPQEVNGRQSGPGDPPNEAPQTGRLTATGPIITDMVTKTADQVLLRAVQTASTRLVTALHATDEKAAKALMGEPPSRLLTVAGHKAVQAAHTSVSALLDGCFDELAVEMVNWLVGDLVNRGVPASEAQARATVAATELVTQLSTLAASAFDRPLRPLPNGSHIPDELVHSAFAAGDLAEIGLPQTVSA